jgi:hypothetical protein
MPEKQFRDRIVIQGSMPIGLHRLAIMPIRSAVTWKWSDGSTGEEVLMAKVRWVVIAGVLTVAASPGPAAQELPPSQRPSFAGTWAPSDPKWSEVLFVNGMSSVASVSGQGRLIIEQRPDRLTITKQLPDDKLDIMLNFIGRYDTTTVYRIEMSPGRSGGFGAAGDPRAGWRADRLVFEIRGAAKPQTVAFSMDGERLKVETHVVVSPGKENNTPEWFTRVK